MERVALVGVADLRWLELTCAKCKASVTFDMAAEPGPQYPEACPACKKEWNGFISPNVEKAFTAFQNFYKEFSVTSFAAKFRVSMEEKT